MNVYKDTLEILRGSDVTAADIARLRLVLEGARQKQRPPKEVVEEIEREVPRFGPLAKQLLVPKNAGEFWSLFSAAVAVASLVVAESQSGTKVYQDRSVHETVVISQPAPASSIRPFRRQPKIGPNVPCPCGSGKKHKHCHGRRP